MHKMAELGFELRRFDPQACTAYGGSIVPSAPENSPRPSARGGRGTGPGCVCCSHARGREVTRTPTLCRTAQLLLQREAGRRLNCVTDWNLSVCLSLSIYVSIICLSVIYLTYPSIHPSIQLSIHLSR